MVVKKSMSRSGLIEMPLHSKIEIREAEVRYGIQILRVLGGWIYSILSVDGATTSSCFVPESINVNVKEDFS